jgi:uncharacterized membrane protein YgdD (TMEM256/DUF423 family)
MQTTSRIFLALGAVALLVAVGLGAYGTHALAARLPPASYSAFSTAIEYQFYHGLGLLAVAVVCERYPGSWLFRLAGWLLVAGLVLFCGSLIAVALGAPRFVGASAPLGGTAFMAAWASLAVGAWRAAGRGAANPIA